MSLLELLQDLVPDSWFNDIRVNYGLELSDDMIIQSVQEASDFFNIENPMFIVEDFTTGVYTNMDMTAIDDILIFNRDQLLDMGITEKEGLDLVMTHEGAHRALQGLALGFDSHQEELCCDFMAGVRAGLNGIDVSQMENSLSDTPVSESHPGGTDRVDSIEKGVQFAQDYMEKYRHAPSFSECLDFFNGEVEIDDVTHQGKITHGPEHSSYTIVSYSDTRETLGSAAFVTVDENDPSFKGYTQAEINRKKTKAEKEQHYHESMVRHHTSMAKHGLTTADTKSHLHQAELHQRRANEWRDEYQKWDWTKPDTK